MRVLVTNDDGIDAPGLRELAVVVHEQGHDVVVAAPHQEASGSSCSLSWVQEDGRVVFHRHERDFPSYAVLASPAFISLIALRGAFGPRPDVVVSGINDGPNTGRAVIHSGTVGAALTAATYGTRGLAVSMELGEPKHWSAARRLVPPVLRALCSSPAGTTLNLNVPNRKDAAIQGLRPAHLAPFGTVQTRVAASGEGFVKLVYAAPDEAAPAGSDAALLAAGFGTVTALQPTTEVVDASLARVLAG